MSKPAFRLVSTLFLIMVLLQAACNAPAATPTPTRTPQGASPQPTDVPHVLTPEPQATNPPGHVPETPAATAEPAKCGGEGRPTPEPRPTPTTVFVGKWPHLASPEYSIQAFMWWRYEVAQRDTQLVAEMGFTWIKQTFAWIDVELAKDEFDWCRPDQIVDLAAYQGLNLLVRLDHTPDWAARPGDSGDRRRPANVSDFGDYCYAVASRFAGRIRAYQVWNEPNLDREWGMASPNPAEYVELLKACYEGVKRGDPNAIVISAGLAPTGTDTPQVIPDIKFVEGVYAAGGAPYFDMLGFNAPGYAAPPEMDPAEAEATWNGRWFCFRHVEDVREVMVANGDADKQIAVLEVGWTTDTVHPDYSWFRVDEATQADYLVRAYQYAKENWSPWIGLMSMIYIADADWTEENEQYWWAITYPDYPNTRVRPAYEALKNMPK